MAALNNAITADDYSSAATLEFQPARVITVQIANAGVMYQLSLSYGTQVANQQWQEERFLQPGFWNFDPEDFNGGQCTGIRFRSAVTSLPASVTVSA